MRSVTSLRAATSRRRHLSTALASRPPRIHPTAIIKPGAVIGANAEVGPYCIVGSHVTLGDGVRLDSHVRIDGDTVVGRNTRVHSFATLGAEPFDLKHDPAANSTLVIGEQCRIAEYAHLSGGTSGGGGSTRLGDGCFIMSHCHVAHDCMLGDGVLLAVSAALAGHCHVGSGARISGYACVHQRVRIGMGAFVGGGAVLAADLIPYGLAVGNRATLASLNLVGLRRQRSGPEAAEELRLMLAAFRYLFEIPLRGGGFYVPMELPHRPTLAARADEVARSLAAGSGAPEEAAPHGEGSGLAGQNGASHSGLRGRFPRLSELLRFVRGQRDVKGGSGAGGGAAAVTSSNGALCLPSKRVGS